MRLIRQVFLGPDGVDLDYIDSSDVRAQGEVYKSQHLSIARGGELTGIVADTETALEALLDAALQLWSTTAVFDPTTGAEGEPQEPDDDDEYNG